MVIWFDLTASLNSLEIECIKSYSIDLNMTVFHLSVMLAVSIPFAVGGMTRSLIFKSRIFMLIIYFFCYLYGYAYKYY